MTKTPITYKAADGPYANQDIPVSSDMPMRLGQMVRLPMADPYLEYALYKLNADSELQFVRFKEIERRW